MGSNQLPLLVFKAEVVVVLVVVVVVVVVLVEGVSTYKTKMLSYFDI